MTKMKNLKISFIIATVDRDEDLQRCVTSIEKAHEYKKDISIETFIVIQKAKEKKNIQVLYQDLINFYYIEELGLSGARNFAIEKSTGEYLVFLDDDAAVNVDFLEVLAKRISEYSEVNAFCGKLLDYDQSTPFSVLFHGDKVKSLNRWDYQYFMGSAHVLSRKVLEKIGYYDKQFGVGSDYYRGGEETDVFFRLKAGNEKVLYLPDLVFLHPITLPSYSYAYNYGHAIGAVMTKHCINDKLNFYIYVVIILKLTSRMAIRLLQKVIFKGAYVKMNERYHYGAWLRGIFRGIKDFIRKEVTIKRTG
ncbi:MAG: glycosyltransferase [Candidatus Omnitrophica bacterium]|nr:glycosyltransferase [Candidatus Omnitrophota bacterium]